MGKELALRGYNTKVLPPLVSERNFTPYLVNIYIYCYLLGIKSEVGEINEDIMSVIEMVDRVINVSVSIVSSKYNLKLLTAFLKLEQVSGVNIPLVKVLILFVYRLSLKRSTSMRLV